MNRDIKFRAWDTATNKFIATGFHVIGEVTMFGVIDQYVLENKLDKTILDRYNDIVITQFTGLLDKNGKEIYEGDIVLLNHWKSSDLFNYKLPFIVEYYEGEINFKQKEYNNFKGSLVGKIDIKIIGNIYENPELL